MKNKELIIFDMDGTLIDSGNVITNTINFVRGHLGLESIEKGLMLEQLNNPDINSAEYFYGTSHFTDEQTALFTQYYDKHCISDIILYDGIKQMLESLESHFILSIATNASRDFAMKMIEYLEIDTYFDLVVGATCVENSKPHPEMIYKTLNNLNIDSTKAILVGDSHKDKRAADAASIDSILVNWGFTNHKEKDVVTHTSNLQDMLLQLKK
jgi:phosphoglycolate phosphatase